MFWRKLLVGVSIGLLGFPLLHAQAYAREYKVAGVFVNVRSAPSEEDDIIGIVIKDQELKVLKTEHGWHLVEFGSKEGWIQEKSLEFQGTTLGNLKITADTLNVREKANLEAKILGQVSKGEEYSILKLSEEWIQIEYNGQEGFVYSNYIKPEETLENNVTIIAEDVNLRSGPGTDHKVVATLSKGEKLTHKDSKNGWVLVERENGEEAWVLYSLIRADGVVIERPRTPLKTVASRGGSGVSRSSDQRTRLIEYAKGFLGTRYVWGGTSPNGFDCSGLTNYVYRNFGVTLNRVASDQARQGQWVEKANLRPGDLVFFATEGGSYLSHVGIYIGGGNMIHASGGQYRSGQVKINSINSGYFANTYMTARTYLP